MPAMLSGGGAKAARNCQESALSETAWFVMTALAALGAAIVGGIFYAFSSFVMRALARLVPLHGAQAMQMINVVVITPSFMTVFMGTAALSIVLVAALALAGGHANAVLLVAASASYVLGCFGVTLVFNVPLNNRLAALDGAPAADYWPKYVAPWVRWNTVRTVASLLSSGLFVAALVEG
jgi:uncharacterized membrane protein